MLFNTANGNKAYTCLRIKQNPELANFLFNRKALEGLLEENATLILDPNTPPFNLLTQPDATKAEKP